MEFHGVVFWAVQLGLWNLTLWVSEERPRWTFCSLGGQGLILLVYPLLPLPDYIDPSRY